MKRLTIKDIAKEFNVSISTVSKALNNSYEISTNTKERIQKFEFNASFYYLFREIGYLFRGWNEIAIIGKITPILTLIFIGCLSFFRKNGTISQLITALLFGGFFYYMTTTTMHPWYLATLVILSVFTRYRFTIVWSFVIVLSYQVYANSPWEENLWFVGFEYFIVLCCLIFELKRKKNIQLT